MFEKVKLDPKPSELAPLLIVDTIKDAQKILRAINNAYRLTLISLLKHDVEHSVSYLIKETKWEQSVVSQHLSILRNASIVKIRRDGKFVFYSLNQTNINFVMTKCIELTSGLLISKKN